MGWTMAKNITQSLIDAALRDARRTGRRQELADARVRGLELRTLADGHAQWSWRTEIGGVRRRFVIGLLQDWPLEEARAVAVDALMVARRGHCPPHDEWWDERLERRVGAFPGVPYGKRSIPFEQAALDYLAEVDRTLRKDTARDYRSKLRHPALQPLAKRLVATITRIELAEIVAAVHRRSERVAETLAVVFRRMWVFLADDERIRLTGVEPDAVAMLKAPRRSGRREPVTELERRQRRKARVAPEMAELGRALAIARAGAFRDEVGLAIELVLFTAQRRRPVATAELDEFVAVPGHGGLWSMSPLHRKTADLLGDDMDHVVPIPQPLWGRIAARIEQSAAAGSRFLFPASRLRRRGAELSHMAPENLTLAFRFMPTVDERPHRLRKAFATRGEILLGNTPDQTAQILDHNEGVPTRSVRRVYALHDGTHEKWIVMKRWAAALEDARAQAVADDPSLLDGERLASAVEAASRSYRMRVSPSSHKSDGVPRSRPRARTSKGKAAASRGPAISLDPSARAKAQAE